MAVYTELLAAGTQSGFGPTVIYTVPSGKVVVVRDIVLSQTDVASAALLVQASGPGGSYQYVAGWNNAPQYQVQHWDGRQVLHAGDTLRFQTNVINGQYRITGYVFDAP